MESHPLAPGGRRAPIARRPHTRLARPTWRCGWCSGDRAGDRRPLERSETTGICSSCLAARRTVGTTQHGPGFVIWDEDAATAKRWADELRSAAAARRRAACTTEGTP